MKLQRTVTLLIVMVCAFVLALPTLAQDMTATPDVKPSADFYNLDQYRGPGYSLLIPTNATISETDASTTLIMGPTIDIRPSDTDFQVQGNAYQLTVTVEDNPQALTAAEFATQSIEKAYADVVAQGGPSGGLPVTSDGKLDVSQTAETKLAGQPGFVVRYFSFDSYTPVIYVAHGDKIYEFSYQENIVANQPIALVQQDVYALMLATLQFDTP